MHKPHLIWSHGRDSRPWGSKSLRLKSLAEEMGFSMSAPDYVGIMDADERVRMLLEHASGISGPVALLGSSMGGYVSAVASFTLAPLALFLLAPAFYLDFIGTVRDFSQATAPTRIIHGWHDDVVPYEKSVRYAREHLARLTLVDGGHRLGGNMDEIEDLFRLFLRDLDAVDVEVPGRARR